ncbi:17910_t:CDS:2, partial [Gigaspora rosea]
YENENMNQQAYSQSIIQSVAFHPNAQVAMISELDKTICLFQIMT